MNDPSGLLLTHREGAVLWLTLNRPEKRNALNDALIRELKRALLQADADDGVKAVALQGAGKDFCAGADLTELQRATQASAIENLADAEALGELFLCLRRLRKPVVAVVHGRALAGGCGLATGCDLVLAGESASFGYPEVAIGFVPAMVMAMLSRNVGEKRAFALVCLGRRIPAAEAERIGLVNHVFPDPELARGAQELVGELASRSSSALQLCKRLLYQQDGMTFEAAMRAGVEMNVIARMTEDARTGIAGFTGTATPEG